MSVESIPLRPSSVREVHQTGAPGAPHPSALATGDPVATWREARAETLTTLDAELIPGSFAWPGATPCGGRVSSARS